MCLAIDRQKWGKKKKKKKITLVLFTQMKKCLPEEVQDIFQHHSTLSIPYQPCETREGQGKQTPSAELCKQQPMVTDCAIALRCSTPLPARL